MMDQSLFEYPDDAWQSLVNDIGSWFTQHGIKIIIILVLAWALHHFASSAISKIMNRTVRHDLYPTKADREKRVKTLDSLVGAIVQIAVYVIAGIMIIGELGVNTGPLIASAGVLGVALGFGAQSLIRDLTAGIFIIADNQYRVGDIVRLNDVEGKVEAITIRTTVLRDLGGNFYHIPNGSIIVTANMTMGYGGIHENLLMDESVDIDRLSHIINHIGEEMAADPKLKDKIKEAPYFKRVVGFTDGGVEIKILGRTTVNDQWEVKDELYRRLFAAFQKNHIPLPTSKSMMAAMSGKK